MADKGGGEDELAEPVLGDGQVEEDRGSVSGRVEGVKQSILGFVLLLVDELAADEVFLGESRDTRSIDRSRRQSRARSRRSAGRSRRARGRWASGKERLQYSWPGIREIKVPLIP